ncbi:MAG: FAD-dependent oxidoreductase [Bryobacterales bacterium]
MKPPSVRTVQLVESVVINHEVRHLIFESVRESSFDFTPGQHLCLGTTLNGERIERYYSIASAPAGDNRFEVCVKASPAGGGFGQRLATMKPGDQLDCMGPSGGFRLKEPVRDAVFVAGGTGLAPLRAMLHHLIAREDRSGGAQLTLILGTRQPDWRYYYDEFTELAARAPNFRFWPTISRPTEGWTGRTGYAQPHLEEALAGRAGEVDVYLCGHSAMVRQIRESLEQTGFDIGSIVYEKYG